MNRADDFRSSQSTYSWLPSRKRTGVRRALSILSSRRQKKARSAAQKAGGKTLFFEKKTIGTAHSSPVFFEKKGRTFISGKRFWPPPGWANCRSSCRFFSKKEMPGAACPAAQTGHKRLIINKLREIFFIKNRNCLGWSNTDVFYVQLMIKLPYNKLSECVSC